MSRRLRCRNTEVAQYESIRDGAVNCRSSFSSGTVSSQSLGVRPSIRKPVLCIVYSFPILVRTFVKEAVKRRLVILEYDHVLDMADQLEVFHSAGTFSLRASIRTEAVFKRGDHKRTRWCFMQTFQRVTRRVIIIDIIRVQVRVRVAEGVSVDLRSGKVLMRRVPSHWVASARIPTEGEFWKMERAAFGGLY